MDRIMDDIQIADENIIEYVGRPGVDIRPIDHADRRAREREEHLRRKGGH